MPWRSILLAGGVLLAAVFFGGGYFGVPALARHVWIPDLDGRMGGAVEVRAIRFDPFSFTLRLEGVGLAAPGGERVAWASRLMLRLRPATFFRRGLHLKEVRFDEPECAIDLTEGETPALARALEATSPGTWGTDVLSVERIAVVDATLDLKVAGSGRPFERRLEQLSFSIADLRAGKSGGNAFSMSVLSATGERLSLGGKLALEPFMFDGRAELEGLRAQDLARWLGDGWDFELVHGIVDLGLDCRLDAERGLGGIRTGNGTLGIRNLVLRPRDRDEPFAALDMVFVDGIEIDPSERAVRVGSVEAAGGRHLVERRPDGELSLVRYLSVDPGKGWSRLPPEWTLLVESMTFKGQSVRWVDSAVSIPVDLRFEDIGLSVENWGNRPGRTVAFSGSARLGGRGGVGLEGQYLPEFGALSAVVGFDRLPAGIPSAYLRGSAGWRIDAGSVSGRLEAQGVLAGGDVSMNQIRGEARVSGLRAETGSGDAVGWETLVLRGIGWSGPSAGVVRAESARLKGMEIELRTGLGGNLPGLPGLEVGSLEIAEGRISLGDGSEQSAGFEGTGDDLRFGRDLAGTLACRFELEGRVNGRGRVHADFDGGPVLDVELEDVAVAPVSSWLEPVAGRRFTGGSMAIGAKLEGGRSLVHGGGSVTFSALSEEAEVDDGASRGASWALARALLEDVDGVWRLDAPLRFDLRAGGSSPAEASQSALESAVEGVAGDPYEALGTVFAGKAPQVLSEVAFLPGAGLPPEASVAGLALYSRILEERPLLCLELTAGVDPAVDGPAMRAAAWDALVEPELERTGDLKEAIANLYEERFPPKERFILFRVLGIFAPMPSSGSRMTHEEMAKALLDTIEPGPEAFTALAGQRAVAVREAIVQGSGIDPERIRLPVSEEDVGLSTRVGIIPVPCR